MGKQKMGRPTKGDAARTVPITIKVSKREHATWLRAAGVRALRDWIRDQCNRAAKTP